ncbi:aldehyde dehydrogenase family protein [Nocardioides sp.]|uniref:aldehyde dehydrogenase family protein n=1 Tax=Nocardioides sp. TaxID=35761 RepID=UPI003517D26F
MRLDVRKTYKLYVGGAFPRSESGHTYAVTDAEGTFVANAALASRKDARDAVTAARAAFGGWSTRTAYNRGQVVYRIAEVLEARRAQFVAAVVAAEGLDDAAAQAVVDASVDRLVWYAGWADKLAQVLGNANPVAGPFLNVSTPEPTGVVAVLAPQASSLLGLVSTLAPVIVSGNTAVVVSSYARPVPAVELAEVLATSDVPGGVVNILTGDTTTLGPWLAAHRDVDAVDLAGCAGLEGGADLARDLEAAAAENLARVRRAPAAEPDWTADPGLAAMTAFLETKTVWHPRGV